MWPDSPFARPVSSYERPVPLVLVDPCDNPDVAIYVRSEWIPYILGSLKQLMLQTTWATDDREALNLVQSRVATLLDCVAGSVAPIECNEAITESDYEMAICEQIRFQNGKLQGLCCGVWTDITGQPSQGWQSGQPGGGTEQPTPGGGCQSYSGVLNGGGLWLLPTVVNTGDTIQVSSPSGATYNPANGLWHCPDGKQFLGGACLPSTFTAGGNPMPAVNTGKLIAKIGATFYDVYTGGVFNVPAGVTNQPVTFQINYASLTGASGDINFGVTVCNNQAAIWDHTLNLALVDGHFVGYPYVTEPGSVYVAGNGWTANQTRSNDGSATKRYTTNSVRYDWVTATTILQVTYTYNITFGGNAGGSARQVAINKRVAGVSTNLVNAAAAAGAGQTQTYAVSTSGVTGLELTQTIDDAGAGNVGGGSGLIYQIRVRGQGFDPFA